MNQPALVDHRLAGEYFEVEQAVLDEFEEGARPATTAMEMVWYHVYGPQAKGGGQLVPTEPVGGEKRVLPVTAQPAIGGLVPPIARDCPKPIPGLP